MVDSFCSRPHKIADDAQSIAKRETPVIINAMSARFNMSQSPFANVTCIHSIIVAVLPPMRLGARALVVARRRMVLGQGPPHPRRRCGDAGGDRRGRARPAIAGPCLDQGPSCLRGRALGLASRHLVPWLTGPLRAADRADRAAGTRSSRAAFPSK
jgi:hypothetical protein